MKKITIPTIPPSPRLLGAYDKGISDVEAMLESIRSELRGGGYEGSDAEVLAAAFVPGWIESVERSKLESMASPAKELLQDLASARIAPLAARLEEIHKDLAGMAVCYEDVIYPLSLKSNDFESVGGMLKVKASRRAKFIEDMTRTLDESEAKAYAEFTDILPRLQALKVAGWNVAIIVEGRCGKYAFQKGVPGTEGLAEDVIKFRYPKNN